MIILIGNMTKHDKKSSSSNKNHRIISVAKQTEKETNKLFRSKQQNGLRTRSDRSKKKDKNFRSDSFILCVRIGTRLRAGIWNSVSGEENLVCSGNCCRLFVWCIGFCPPPAVLCPRWFRKNKTPRIDVRYVFNLGDSHQSHLSARCIVVPNRPSVVTPSVLPDDWRSLKK